MSYELIGSFLIFLFLGATSFSPYRHLMYAIVIWYFNDSYFLAFFLGMALCDLYVNQKLFMERIFKRSSIVCLLGLIGLFMGSYPYIDTSDTIYHFLNISYLGYDSLLVNHIWGAFLLMVAILYSPFLQNILSRKGCLFLGKISFSLYLLHFTLLCSFTSFLFSRFINNYSYNTSAFLSILISLPLFLTMSYAMYMYVDRKSIIWAKTIFLRFIKVFSLKKVRSLNVPRKKSPTSNVKVRQHQ